MKECIGVIGAGVMGCAITALFCNFGYQVLLWDSEEEALKRAEEQIKKENMVYMFRRKNAGFKKHEMVHCLEELKDCSVIIEAISEDIEEKERLFEELKGVGSRNKVLISNTSCVPISRLAACCDQKENVLGVHFMNPVAMIGAVEVIRTKDTSEEVLTRVMNLLGSVEKEYIVVNDSPGFVSNRISHLYMNEAAYLLQEGVATAEGIDQIFKKCYAHKMGPLETADLIGIDVVADSLHVLYQEFQNEKYKCCPLLLQMVERGEFGRKTGKGFYQY